MLKKGTIHGFFSHRHFLRVHSLLSVLGMWKRVNLVLLKTDNTRPMRSQNMTRAAVSNRLLLFFFSFSPVNRV